MNSANFNGDLISILKLNNSNLSSSIRCHTLCKITKVNAAKKILNAKPLVKEKIRTPGGYEYIELPELIDIPYLYNGAEPKVDDTCICLHTDRTLKGIDINSPNFIDANDDKHTLGDCLAISGFGKYTQPIGSIDLYSISSSEISVLEEGQRYYNTTDKKIYVSNGESWLSQGGPNSNTIYINKESNRLLIWSSNDLIEVSGGSSDSGTGRLYDELGYHTDGAITQKATTEALELKVEYDEIIDTPDGIIPENKLENYYTRTEADETFVSNESLDSKNYATETFVMNHSPLPLGMIIHSTKIIKSAGLHLADGSELMIGGVYDDFCQYVINNQDEFPNILYDDEDLTIEGAQTALEKWQAEFATYGQCGKYVITDSYIKLPAITKLTGGLASTDLGSMASVNEQGLPNITGSVWLNSVSDTTRGSGALRTSRSGSGAGGTSYNSGNLTFDASLSNPIYGKSSKVEVEYLKFPYYIVVATVTRTEIAVNIDNVATELNNKVGKNECVRYPVSKWISSDGLKWYTVYNDGWKECGGVATRNTAVLYGITFTKEPTLVLNYKYLDSSNNITSSDTPIKITSSSTLSGFTFGTYHIYTKDACYYACGF